MTKTIVVNDSYRLLPDAYMLYAADHKWWRHHNFAPEFNGIRATQQIGPKDWVEEVRRRQMAMYHCKHGLELNFNQGEIASGWNSAFQALNIAVHMQPERVLLLGVDLHTTSGAHWFGEHPPELKRASPWTTFQKAFDGAEASCHQHGIELINCSKGSRLRYPYMSLEDALR